MVIIVYKMAVSSTSAANGWFSHREVWPPSLGANFLYRVGEALEACPQTFGGQCGVVGCSSRRASRPRQFREDLLVARADRSLELAP